MSEGPGASAGEGTVARNTAFAFASQFTTALFTAGLTLYLVRALGPEEYGLFALALAVGLLVLQPSDLGLTHSTARFVADHRGSLAGVTGVFADGLRLKLLVGAIVSAVLFVLAGPISNAYGEPDLVWPLRGIALATFFQGLLGFITTTFVALRRVALNFRVVLSESAVEAGATVTLVLLGGAATSATFGRTIGYAVGVVFALVLVVRLLGRRSISIGEGGHGHVRRVAGYAGAMFVIDWAYTAMTQVDSLVIGAILGTAQVGVFQAPLRLITPLVYPGLALAQAVAPRMSRGSGEPDIASFERALRSLLFLQVAITIPVLAFAEPLSTRVLGPGYEGSAEVLQALTPFIFVWGFAPLFSLSVNYLGEARRRVPVAIAAVLVNLGLDLALIPGMGIVGAAIASDIALAFYTGGHVLICRSLLGLSLKPLIGAAARTALAAAPMTVLLLTIAPGAGIPTMIGGTLIAWGLFAVALLGVGAVTREETRRAWSRMRRSLTTGGEA